VVLRPEPDALTLGALLKIPSCLVGGERRPCPSSAFREQDAAKIPAVARWPAAGARTSAASEGRRPFPERRCRLDPPLIRPQNSPFNGYTIPDTGIFRSITLISRRIVVGGSRGLPDAHDQSM